MAVVVVGGAVVGVGGVVAAPKMRSRGKLCSQIDETIPRACWRTKCCLKHDHEPVDGLGRCAVADHRRSGCHGAKKYRPCRVAMVRANLRVSEEGMRNKKYNLPGICFRIRRTQVPSFSNRDFYVLVCICACACVGLLVCLFGVFYGCACVFV